MNDTNSNNPTNDDPTTIAEQMNDQLVSHYLRQHPDFFIAHEALLLNLKFQHGDTDVPSILTRQIELLKQEYVGYNKKLSALIETAKQNDVLFDQFRQLITALASMDSIQSFNATLIRRTTALFSLPHCTLLTYKPLPPLIHMNQQCVTLLEKKTLNKAVSCGRFSQSDKQKLFDNWEVKQPLVLKSFMIAKIGTIGFWVIGSEAEDYFHADLQDIFLKFTADVIDALLHRIVEK